MAMSTRLSVINSLPPSPHLLWAVSLGRGVGTGGVEGGSALPGSCHSWRSCALPGSAHCMVTGTGDRGQIVLAGRQNGHPVQGSAHCLLDPEIYHLVGTGHEQLAIVCSNKCDTRNPLPYFSIFPILYTYNLNCAPLANTIESIFNMEYLDFYLVVVWLTKCVMSAYLP